MAFFSEHQVSVSGGAQHVQHVSRGAESVVFSSFETSVLVRLKTCTGVILMS